MKSKILVVVLVTVLLLAPMQNAYARGGIPPAYSDIVERYGLRVVEAIPTGVIPFQFQNPKQLEDFLSTISRQVQRIPHSNSQYENHV